MGYKDAPGVIAAFADAPDDRPMMFDLTELHTAM